MRIYEDKEAIGMHSKSAFSLLKALVRLAGIRTGRLRIRMEESRLVLRLYRLRDLITLRSLWRRQVFLAASGVRLKPLRSLISFWRWVHTTFQLLYIIEVEERNARRIMGFLGIYNMQLGRELWVSLVVLDGKDRGRGYGRRALGLLLSSLQEDRTVNRVCGEVLITNTQSLRLLQGLGFLAYGYNEDRLLLRKTLG